MKVKPDHGDVVRTRPRQGGESEESLVDDELWVDQCRKGDLDMEGMVADRVEDAHRKWQEAEEKYPLNHGMSTDSRMAAIRDRQWDCGVGPNTTLESMLKDAQVPFCTFAVLKDGQWYEKGSMGWFGSVAGNKTDAQWSDEFIKLLDSLPDDALLSIVDCHI